MNGAGKSTLLDALCFALFNRAFRDIKKEQLVNTINQNDCQIECEFEANIAFNENQALSKNSYYNLLCDNHFHDLKTGYTTIGPHKDNIDLFFNNMPIKECGSQGEKKLFLIVLKIAEAIYISTIINKEPIILLDD